MWEEIYHEISKKVMVVALAAAMTVSMLTACGGGGGSSTGGSNSGSSNGGNNSSNVGGDIDDGNGKDDNSGTGSSSDKDNNNGNDTDKGEDNSNSVTVENIAGSGSFPITITWQKSKASKYYGSEKYTIDATLYEIYAKNDTEPIGCHYYYTTDGNKEYYESSVKDVGDMYTYADRSANKFVETMIAGWMKTVRESKYVENAVDVVPSLSNIKSIHSGIYTYKNVTYPAELFELSVKEYGKATKIVCYQNNKPVVVVVETLSPTYMLQWLEYNNSYKAVAESEKLNFDVSTLKQKFVDDGYTDIGA